MILGNAQADQLVHNEKNNQRSDNRQHPGDRDADELIENLAIIAFEKSGGAAVFRRRP